MGLAAFNRMRRLKAQKEAVLHEGEVVVPAKTADRAYAEYTAQEIIDMNAKEQKAFIEKHELAIEGFKSMKAPELEAALLAFLGLEVATEEAEGAETTEEAVNGTEADETSDAE
ncbi:hypothetical protein [Solibacillus isronensis]|uniref:hypothetical protein n=1 Tax=Solibacillus isronensis TaxID=412383 RepID=UPI00399FFEC7